MKYQEEFDRALSDIHQLNLAGIWFNLFVREINDVEKTEDKLKILKEFFVYGMKKNVILEYSQEKGAPVFSHEEPEVVVERMLADFPLDKIPSEEVERYSEFQVYAAFKHDTWVTLLEGTGYCIPG